MVTKQAASVLTILGGVFYIIGSIAGSIASAIMFGFMGGLGYRGTVNYLGAVDAIFAFGLLSGALIIVAGAMINSNQASWRKAGGTLAVVMMILGALPTLGGLVIGFFLTLIGAVLGLTYSGPMEVRVIHDASPQATLVPRPNQEVIVRYCIKCGSPLLSGADFCQTCGAKVPKT